MNLIGEIVDGQSHNWKRKTTDAATSPDNTGEGGGVGRGSIKDGIAFNDH